MTLAESDTRAAPATRPRLAVAMIAVIAACLAVVSVAGGYLWGASGDSASSGSPSTTSVDAGFARDMSTHHTQAVTMANYERDNTSDSALQLLAYDIETGQQFQIGQMAGWLDTWGLSRSTDEAQMAWMTADHDMNMQMGSDGLMPGMASSAELEKLLSSHGTPLDVLFLQLMIRHHQGGVEMAKYAAANATEDYVRTTAGSMVASQSSEIVSMEQMLRKLGGTPLPAP